MKDKKKITITYDETVKRTITCYAPHSKYILRKNIISTLLLMCFCFLPCALMSLIFNDIQLLYFSIGCSTMMLCIGLYNLINEWCNGRGYKQAIRIIQNNTNQEERERVFEEFKKQEQI